MLHLYGIEELRDTFTNLVRNATSINGCVYEHTENFGLLGLAKNELATKLQQLFMVAGVGKSLHPLIDYDPNTTILKFNKSTQFSNGIGLIYSRQFHSVLSTLAEQKYAMFWFTQRDHNSGQKNYFNKVRIAGCDMSLYNNELIFRISFQPCLVLPGLLYDLAMFDILIDNVTTMMAKSHTIRSHRTIFNFSYVKGNGSEEMILPEGQFSGFTKRPSLPEANEILSMEEKIRQNKLSHLPKTTMPLNNEAIEFLNSVIKFHKAGNNANS